MCFRLCASFLDHLESWRTDASERALDDTAGKEEELRNELELRLHLHEPRPSRVEDIHNTRSGKSGTDCGEISAIHELHVILQNVILSLLLSS